MVVDPDNLTPEEEQYFNDLGLDPESALVGNGWENDPDTRARGFETLEDALIYLTEEAALLVFSRIYYDDVEDTYYVAIPDDSGEVA
jgi:hypothetical protein